MFDSRVPNSLTETLMCSLAVVFLRRYDFRNADVIAAFLYANLPAVVKLLAAEIPKGHPDYDERREKILPLVASLVAPFPVRRAWVRKVV